MPLLLCNDLFKTHPNLSIFQYLNGKNADTEYLHSKNVATKIKNYLLVLAHGSVM